MRFSLTQVAVTSICILASPALPAADAAVPIWEPTTITEPGRYVLTRDIVAFPPTPPLITVQANNVTIDLNGFTLYGDEPVILAEQVSGLTIHGGTVDASNQAIRLENVNSFVLRDLILWTGEDPSIILFNGERGRLERISTVMPISVYQVADLSLDEITGSEIWIDDCVRCQVTRSSLAGVIQMFQAEGSTIFDNRSALISMSGSGNRIAKNVSDFGIQGSGHLIENNVGDLSIGGDGNTIRDNLGNLTFSSEADGNLYRGNSGGVLDDQGTNNLSHGDNYLPGPM